MPNYRTNTMRNDNASYGRPLDLDYSHMEETYHSSTDQDNLSKLPLAMAYVPFQTWNKTFETDEVLNKGTLFPDLYKPFLGAGGYKK